MEEILTKKEFVEKCNNRINARVQLSDFRKGAFVDVVNKFDGKVYNKRFKDAIKNAFNSDMFFVSESGNSLVINLRTSKYNYSEYESIYFNLVLDNGRINAKETLSEHYTVVWLDNFDKETETIKKSIYNYDSYLQAAKDLEKMIQKFSNIPYCARQNFKGFRSWILQ